MEEIGTVLEGWDVIVQPFGHPANNQVIVGWDIILVDIKAHSLIGRFVIPTRYIVSGFGTFSDVASYDLVSHLPRR